MALEAYYDGVFSAEKVDWDNAPGKNVIIAAIRHFVDRGVIKKNARIVDIGCGTGILLNRLCQQVSPHFDLYGVDFSQVAIERGRSLFSKPHLFCEDGAATHFSDKEFDVLISYGSYEHFDDPGKGIREASRLLIDHGMLFAMIPTLGIDRTDRDDEGWYEERPVAGTDVRQMQWNLHRDTWNSYFASVGLDLLDDSVAADAGAKKPGVFFFAKKGAD